MKNKNLAFYVKADASWKDSTKSGKYFHYSDVTKTNCLITINGNDAIIIDSYGSYTTKKTTGKYFSFTGKQVTGKTFNKYLKAIEAAKEERREIIRQRNEAISNEYREKEAAAKSLILAFIAKNNPDWSKNEGNSHTRRTRWANRGARATGERTWGNLARDTFAELKNVDPDFFIDGKFNENHL